MARVEIFHERARRRWTEADKRRLVAETLAPGETVYGVALVCPLRSGPP